MLEWNETPNSSNIKRVGHDAETQEMQVEFKSGQTYAYSGVSPTIASDMAADPSPGGYFARHIRNKYPTRKL